LLLITAVLLSLIVICNFVVNAGNNYISKKGPLEECNKEDNVVVIVVATAYCLNRRL
jgi:hypothetical protein